MSWQRTTMEIAMLVGLVFYPVLDLVVASTPNATFSEITLHALYRFPPVAFAVGVVMGHLSWPVEQTRPHWITILLVVSALLTVAGTSWARLFPPTMPVLPLVLGIVFGHLLWPQKVATQTGEGLYERVFPAAIQTRTQRVEFPGERPGPVAPAPGASP